MTDQYIPGVAVLTGIAILLVLVLVLVLILYFKIHPFISALTSIKIFI
jgi:hypothetical protein